MRERVVVVEHRLQSRFVEGLFVVGTRVVMHQRVDVLGASAEILDGHVVRLLGAPLR